MTEPSKTLEEVLQIAVSTRYRGKCGLSFNLRRRLGEVRRMNDADRRRLAADLLRHLLSCPVGFQPRALVAWLEEQFEGEPPPEE